MNKVTCKCGAALGEYVEREGKARLLLGNVLITKSIHSVCAVCERQFIWCATEKRLDDLVQKVLDRQAEKV